MSEVHSPIVPPAPTVPEKDLSSIGLVVGTLRNNLAIWPTRAFEEGFSRSRVFGIESVLVNDPDGVRHVMTTRAANYVRPVIMPRIARPLVGQGVFLAEGAEWRKQRRMLAPSFTPGHVGLLLPHFQAAAEDLVRDLEARPDVDLLTAFQTAALNAALRALFSLPDEAERNRIADIVRGYVSGPGQPQVFDGFARTESDFGFSLGPRRAFQKRWFAVVDALVAGRRTAPHAGGERDFLDLLLAVRDPETGLGLNADEVRDQSATMIFAAYETTARMLFWASYLLTLDPAEQARLHVEVAAFPPDRVTGLEDLGHWPRLRLLLLEALRLYPPLPLLVRQPVEDDVILGEPVRPGVQVFISPWVLHRHRRHWANPAALMPDRFAGQTSPWTSGGAFIPFGAGPRICLGAAFALAEAQILLAALLQRFTLAIPGSRPVLPVGGITTRPDHAPVFRLGRPQ